MSSTDDPSETDFETPRGRKRRNSSLLMLAAGLLFFGIAAGALYYVLRPVTLRIAVGPAGSDDQKLVQALAKAFTHDGSPIRLSVITNPSPGMPKQGRSFPTHPSSSASADICPASASHCRGRAFNLSNTSAPVATRNSSPRSL